MTAAGEPAGRSDRNREFTELYIQERTRLRRLAAFLAPHVDWEAAVHDGFVTTLEWWERITGSKAAFLRTTVLNNIKDLVKRCERPADISDAFADLWKNTHRVQVQRSRSAEEWHELRETFAAVHMLPDQQRYVVSLRFMAFNDTEIAEALNIDRDTVRRYMSAALQTITLVVGNPERRLGARRSRIRRPKELGLPRQREERS